jgi:hypothetical protein
MTFVSPPLETGTHTDERRTDNENDDMTFASPPLEAVKHTDVACTSFFSMFYCL